MFPDFQVLRLRFVSIAIKKILKNFSMMVKKILHYHLFYPFNGILAYGLKLLHRFSVKTVTFFAVPS